jgi:hypothetical protein
MNNGMDKDDQTKKAAMFGLNRRKERSDKIEIAVRYPLYDRARDQNDNDNAILRLLSL